MILILFLLGLALLLRLIWAALRLVEGLPRRNEDFSLDFDDTAAWRRSACAGDPDPE